MLYLCSLSSGSRESIEWRIVMDLNYELALLTDEEAELCLNGVLKGLTARDPNYEQVLNDPRQMTEVVTRVAAELGESTPPLANLEPKQKPKAIRVILVEMA